MAQGEGDAIELLPLQPSDRDGHLEAFRKLISDLSEHLRPEEVGRCSFLRVLPPDRTQTALDTLSYLMKIGEFSHNNVEPLVNLLKDVKRHDLVNTLVEPYKKEHPGLSCSLPVHSNVPRMQLKERSNTAPINIPQSSHIVASSAVQETGAAEQVSSFTTQHMYPMQPTPSTQRINPMGCETGDMAVGAAQVTSTTIPRELNQPATGDISAVQMQKTYNVPTAKHCMPRPYSSATPERMSNCSSTVELEQSNPSLNENPVTTSHPLSLPLQQEKAEKPTHRRSYHTYNVKQQTPILPRANSYPRSVKLNTQLPSSSTMQGTVITPPSTLAHHAHKIDKRAQSVTRRSITPPASTIKRTSAPVVFKRGSSGFENHSLPRGFHPSSHASGSDLEHSRPSSCELLDNEYTDQQNEEYSPNGVFPNSHPFNASSQAEGSEHFGIGATCDHTMLFRKRAGSKKRLLSKFRPFRNRSSSKSNIFWSVKRDKLNEAIYKPRKEKLFKCPHILELENGGKHALRLTLYLHPYGYEEDAGTNLTLVIELSASVKSNIPSSANIHIEVTACESKEGSTLNKVVLGCLADCRILRHKEFLSHDQLKNVECDSIDLQASARLLY